jgi:hypothetical protein
MTDEQQVRSLLTLAAELPDDVQPPVGRLLDRARRRRRVRAISSVLAIVAVTAAAFTLPFVVRALSGGPAGPIGVGGHGGRGPTAAQLTHFRWSSLLPSPLGPRSQPLLSWTGKELIELGGIKNHMQQTDGAAFVPATARWHRIAPAPYNVGFSSGWTGRNYSNVVDAWTGRDLFVTNGDFESCAGSTGGSPAMCYPHAGLYDPATNSWSSTKLPKQMYGLDLQSAVWTGRDVVIAGTSCCATFSPNAAPPAAHPRLGVAAYNPATNHWQMITPPLPARHLPIGVAMVATQDRVLLWSMWSRTKNISDSGYGGGSGVDVLSLDRSGRWSTIARGWPQHETVDNPSYAAGRILVRPGHLWCGLCGSPVVGFAAQLADARTRRLWTIPSGPFALHQFEQPPVWLWNGRSVIAATQVSNYLRGQGQLVWITQMAAFDPVTWRWITKLPVPPGQPPVAANPIWAGRQLLLITASGGLLSFHS